MSRLQELCTLSGEEEDRVLAHRVALTMQHMLTKDEAMLSREETRAKAIGLAVHIGQLEARRNRPHSWELIHVLANAKAEYSLLKWTLFAINELPVEILQRIFTLVIDFSSLPEISQSRRRLASVCSYWRAVAIDTPELWATNLVNMMPPYRLFHLCLERAKAHPLSLFVDQRDRNWSGSQSDDRFGPDNMRDLMLFISSISDRVCQLVIFANTCVTILAALDILQSVPPPPLLQRIGFHRSGNAYVLFLPPTTPPPGLFSACRLFGGAPAPLLNHVSFDGVYIDFSMPTFRNLRIFEMRKMAVEQMPSLMDFLPVLQGSPLLERLTFDAACPQLAEPCNGRAGFYWEPVQLEHLREFTICNLVLEYATYVLHLVSAPQLRRLTLERLFSEDFTPFVEKLIGRFPKVTVLTVNGLGTTNITSLISWLRTMPLRYLKVASVADEFFDALQIRLPLPSAGQHRKPRWPLICSKLEACEVLAWRRINPAVFKNFCDARKRTLNSIFISQADYQAAVQPIDKEWLEKVGILHLMPLGSRPDLKDKYE